MAQPTITMFLTGAHYSQFEIQIHQIVNKTQLFKTHFFFIR